MDTLSTNHMNSPMGHAGPGQTQFVFQNQAEDEQTGFDFWGILGRRKWIVFLGMITGIGLGTFVHYQTAPIYKSSAMVRIEPKDPMVMRVSQGDLMLPSVNEGTRHDKIIATQLTVRACFEANDLYGLSSFVDMQEDDVIKYVLENLEVLPDKEDPLVYRLNFKTFEKTDARVVLSHLILTYEKDLERTYENESNRFFDLLTDIESQFKNNFLAINKKIAEVSLENDALS